MVNVFQDKTALPGCNEFLQSPPDVREIRRLLQPDRSHEERLDFGKTIAITKRSNRPIAERNVTSANRFSLEVHE